MLKCEPEPDSPPVNSTHLTRCLVCSGKLMFTNYTRVICCGCGVTNKRLGWGNNIYAYFDTESFSISGDVNFTRVRYLGYVERFTDVSQPIRLFRGLTDQSIQAMWDTGRWGRLRLLQALK